MPASSCSWRVGWAHPPNTFFVTLFSNSEHINKKNLCDCDKANIGGGGGKDRDNNGRRKSTMVLALFFVSVIQDLQLPIIICTTGLYSLLQEPSFRTVTTYSLRVRSCDFARSWLLLSDIHLRIAIVLSYADPN
jgi:hypothetical protein